MGSRKLLTVVLASGVLGLAPPLVSSVKAASCGDTPTAGTVSVYTSWDQGGSCGLNIPWNNYPTIPLNNTIASLDFGGNKTADDGRSYKTRLMACLDTNFGNTCAGFEEAGNIPYSPAPPLNFLDSISSYRVQPWTDEVRFPTGTSYTYSDGTTTRNCTWGAAYQMNKYYGIYPGWRGDARLWNNNALAHFYEVDNDARPNTLVNVEAGTERQLAKGWSGAQFGGHPTSLIANWPATGPEGHVGWIVDVRSEPGADGVSGNADDVTWLHTLESNIQTSKSGWTTTTQGGAVFFNVYVRFETQDDIEGMGIIHPNG